MRVSTNEIYRTGIAAMQRGQSALSHTQLQLSTGKRILSPADDPRGAVQALQLREKLAAVDQFARNGELAQSRLQQEETVLQQVGDALQRARELTVQASNATQSDDSRAAIAIELRQVQEALVDLANTRDANGEHLFAGFRSGGRPFVENAAGDIEYLGDNGQRFVGLSPDRQVAVGDSGSVFMSVPRGNGVFVATPDPANTGNAWVAASEVIDPTAITSESYTVRFTSPTDYDVLDSTATVIATGTYTDGQAIDIAGRRIVLNGTPGTGDSFAVDPAGVESVFVMLDDLATALETPRSSEAARAQLSHSTGFALQNLDQALNTMIDLRSTVGARLNAIESQAYVDADHKLQLETTLSAVEDLDYTEAISRFAVQQAALQAAQQTYAQVSRLSLFDYLR
jgi:flagellar hook-associated protein 3 FlgL